jgi:hypothetical protein
MSEQFAAMKFENLDLAGKVRKLDTELHIIKNQLATHREVVSALLLVMSTIAERIPGAATDTAAHLDALRFDLDHRSVSDDPDFFRAPK